jgi:LmbE family N-acetylglucosaminyl deacetylase
LNFLGVKEIIFGNFPDGYLSDNHETVDFIESLIKKLKIERVYTHDSNDRHQDHRNCSLAVSAAARGVKEVLLFQGPSTNFFYPHYIIELSEEQIDKKIEALHHYKSQLNKLSAHLSALKHIAAMNGSRHNTSYAEAFALNHMFMGENNV